MEGTTHQYVKNKASKEQTHSVTVMSTAFRTLAQGTVRNKTTKNKQKKKSRGKSTKIIAQCEKNGGQQQIEQHKVRRKRNEQREGEKLKIAAFVVKQEPSKQPAICQESAADAVKSVGKVALKGYHFCTRKKVAFSI